MCLLVVGAEVLFPLQLLVADGLKASGLIRLAGSWDHGTWRRYWSEFDKLFEILGGGGEEELILGAARPAQAQTAKPEDALEMGEQHFNLLSLPA